MGRKNLQKKFTLPEVLLLAVVLVMGAFPGSSINAWASEVTMEASVSENDMVETEEPEGNLEEESEEEQDAEPEEELDVSANEVITEVIPEDTVSDNTVPVEEKTLVVQDLEVSVTEEVKEIYDVELPTLAEESVFNYVLDPQGIITATDAIMYGGVPFEKGATLFFENSKGDYGVSSRSDLLTVTNKSTIPVKISVYANITPADGVIMVSDRAFADESTSLYLALVGEDGTEIPIGTGAEAVLVKEMKEAQTDVFDSFSFGLTGACNSNGDWRFVNHTPKVTVTWKVEPVYE